MNDNEIEKLISARFKSIKNYCRKIIKDFDAKDIHGLRTEVKKLRAFIRLATFSPNNAKEYKLPRKFKNMYSAAGAVRDLQLQLERIKAVTQDDTSRPKQYESLLKKNLKKNKRKLRKLLRQVSIRSVEKKVLSRLPKKLDFTTIQYFVQDKTADIRVLSEKKEEKDDDIHSIRKCLKDLMYIVKSFPDVILREAFPRELSDAAKLKVVEQVTDKLGMFTDMSAAISFMEPAYIDAVDKGEKEQLQLICSRWLQEKKEIRQDAIQEIHAQDVLG